MKIVMDAMGGDHAPKEIVLGAMEAIKEFPQLNIVLVGDEQKIRQYLTSEERIEIIHTTEYISSDDEPVRAVRRKKNSSMVVAAREVKEGRGDVCISAGNTGALMATGLFVLGRISGIERPALAPTMPTIDGAGFMMLDVGANVEAKATHLEQYALMGAIYAEKVRGIQQPKVGLLNVGTEQGKGTELAKESFQLIEQLPINFIGNIESRDLLEHVADVVVTDGFSGNVALKTMEGTALSMFKMIKEEITSDALSKFGALILKSKFKGIKEKLDYSEYGGAMLLGLDAPLIKAHGSSKSKAVVSAIKQGMKMVENDVIDTIKAHIKKEEPTS